MMPNLHGGDCGRALLLCRPRFGRTAAGWGGESLAASVSRRYAQGPPALADLASLNAAVGRHDGPGRARTRRRPRTIKVAPVSAPRRNVELKAVDPDPARSLAAARELGAE